MGYPHGQKRHRMYDLASKQIFTSWDVVFCENILPFAITESKESATTENYGMLSSPLFLNDNENSHEQLPGPPSQTSPNGTVYTPSMQWTTPDSRAIGTDLLEESVSMLLGAPESLTSEINSLAQAPSVSEEVLTRPHRDRTMPQWYQDFICTLLSSVASSRSSIPLANSGVVYPLFSHLSHDRLSAAYSAFLGHYFYGWATHLLSGHQT